MEENGASRDQLEKMRASLEDMKRRLDVLKMAKVVVTGGYGWELGHLKAKEVLGTVQGGAQATWGAAQVAAKATWEGAQWIYSKVT